MRSAIREGHDEELIVLIVQLINDYPICNQKFGDTESVFRVIVVQVAVRDVHEYIEQQTAAFCSIYLIILSIGLKMLPMYRMFIFTSQYINLSLHGHHI